ncbi:MAG: hypothetical protein ACLVKO_00865 [Dysgonomonas sp.]
MKKLLFLSLSVAVFASCNVKNSDEYKNLQAQNDSLMQLSTHANTELSDAMGIINEVEENFNKIREAEKYLAVESNTKGELNKDTKTRINDNFQMINDILKKNRETIAGLNGKLKNNSGQLSGLQKTIERLNTELEERAKTIKELQTSLAARDKQIAEMTSNIQALSSDVENLSGQVTNQATTIKEQDKALNTAFYIFGTSKELKEAKIVSGGFLSSPKVLKESIDKSVFVKIDIRDVKAIPVYAKKAKILSEHPKDSYSLDKDANGQIVVNIKNFKKFWSLTQYLVIEVG